ncbi:DUF6358 family protein [Parapedobacter tibetensis]|uniref:DUF6358 family protein n=1 Tax=Parapedobacter tibetensis TaxID=2972951 RepID=UPI00214D8992|nr:DUF6358 family protein [Parapedobacter tibetensis]
MVKKPFLYNILLNVGLILMILSALAAYDSKLYPVLSISMAIIIVLVYLKYQLLKQVKRTNKDQ